MHPKKYACGHLGLTWRTSYGGSIEELRTTGQFIKNINIPIWVMTKAPLNVEKDVNAETGRLKASCIPTVITWPQNAVQIEGLWGKRHGLDLTHDPSVASFCSYANEYLTALLWNTLYLIFNPTSPPPRREAGDVWCLPPVRNLRAVIWFHFTISCLVFLPSPVTLSVFSFSACWPFLLNLFQKILQYFSLRDRLFCMAPV